MAEANLGDRKSIERIYDRAAFEQDAAWNAHSSAASVRGLKILSPPGGDGAVELARAQQHVGEANPESDTIFLSPHRNLTATATEGNAYSGSVMPAAAGSDHGEYERFIDEIIEAARTGSFKPAIGFGDERLKGFRGG